MPKRSNDNLLCVRADPWTIFALRKYTEMTGEPIGVTVSEAVYAYLKNYPISRRVWAIWRREFKEKGLDKAVN